MTKNMLHIRLVEVDKKYRFCPCCFPSIAYNDALIIFKTGGLFSSKSPGPFTLKESVFHGRP